MKLFHLSDLHIGLRLFQRDLLDDQRYILESIIEEAKKENPDVIMIAGDIYDKAVPSAEAVEIFDDFISRLVRVLPDTAIMMISGNHDSATRVNLFRNILWQQNIYMIGNPPTKEDEFIEKVTRTDAYGNVNFYLLPFVKPSMVKAITGTDESGAQLSYQESVRKLLEREQIDTAERNVFVSHQFYLPVGKNSDEMERMDSEIRTVGNIDEIRTDILPPFDYVALGHIHKPMKVGSEYIRYCGTPIACSVSEAGQQKSIVMIEIREKGNLEITELPLHPKRQVRIIKGTLEEVLQQSCEDYVTVILTDKEELHVVDMQDRLKHAFPYLLEIRREYIKKADDSREMLNHTKLEPLELCGMFLKDLDQQEEELISDIINEIREEMI